MHDMFSRLLFSLFFIVILEIGGCASVGHQLVASNHEYLAYRNVRIAQQLEQRLAAAYQYLQRYPNGRWVSEVQPWFSNVEPRYWSRQKHSVEGASAYLKVLAQGPHASEAMAVVAMHREREQQKRKELLEIQAMSTESRLAELAQQRQLAHELFVNWLIRWLNISSWQKPTSSLEHELIFDWRIAPPQAKCVDGRCAKMLQQPFEIAGGGDFAPRVLVLDAVLMLYNGVVSEARIEGPGLFSRLFESANTRSLKANPLALRVEAIAYAISLVSGAIEAKLPSDKCSVQPVSPIVLHRSCYGWTVKMTVSDSAGEDDVVSIIGPAANPANP